MTLKSVYSLIADRSFISCLGVETLFKTTLLIFNFLLKDLYPFNKGAIPLVIPSQSIINKISALSNNASCSLLSSPVIDTPSYNPFVPSIIFRLEFLDFSRYIFAISLDDIVLKSKL